ncbi:MAG: P-loop NTPase fold protein, partial [Rhodospirillales bacterium]
MDDDKTEKIRERLLEDPRLTVVSDHAIADVAADNFDLPLRIGPVYDILRHPDTVTPLAVAIYGDWGAGKTSAMLWLENRLKDWSAHKPKKRGAGKGKRQKKIRLRTVWFYPWKYQSRDDVWRGLVAEVIIACLSRDLDSTQQLGEEAKDLARFLGKSAWTLVSSLKLSAGAGAKATLDLKALEKVAEHAKDYVHPEAAYLNQFEEALESWVKKSLGGDERLVVFIDDLDRCMPEVALQVLEALKLYLNIGNLIFVVGVDDSVIGDLVVKHYEELGLDESKARQYLAKMFQVEVPLTPSDVQIKDFLASILAANPTWQEIEEQAQSIFRNVIGELAEGSPREVKRLVNSALMRGAGASMSALAHETGKTPPTPEQGMQVFLVHWILVRRHRRGGLVARDVGTRFFRAWSQIVREHPDADPWLALSKEAIAAMGEEGFLDWTPRDEGLPPPPGEPLPGTRPESGRGGETADWERMRGDIPERFLPLLQEKRFHPYLELLADPELGELMRIEDPEEAVSISVTPGSTSAQAIVDEAIARELDKPAGELTPEDRRAVETLDLSQEDLDDLVPL